MNPISTKSPQVLDFKIVGCPEADPTPGGSANIWDLSWDEVHFIESGEWQITLQFGKRHWSYRETLTHTSFPKKNEERAFIERALLKNRVFQEIPEENVRQIAGKLCRETPLNFSLTRI